MFIEDIPRFNAAVLLLLLLPAGAAGEEDEGAPPPTVLAWAGMNQWVLRRSSMVSAWRVLSRGQ